MLLTGLSRWHVLVTSVFTKDSAGMTSRSKRCTLRHAMAAALVWISIELVQTGTRLLRHKLHAARYDGMLSHRLLLSGNRLRARSTEPKRKQQPLEHRLANLTYTAETSRPTALLAEIPGKKEEEEGYSCSNVGIG